MKEKKYKTKQNNNKDDEEKMCNDNSEIADRKKSVIWMKTKSG